MTYDIVIGAELIYAIHGDIESWEGNLAMVQSRPPIVPPGFLCASMDHPDEDHWSLVL